MIQALKLKNSKKFLTALFVVMAFSFPADLYAQAVQSPLGGVTTSTKQVKAPSLGVGATLPVSGQIAPAFGMAPMSPEEMQAQAEEEMEEQKIKVREEAFEHAVSQMMPLTAEELTKALATFKENREAAEQPLSTPEPKIHIGHLQLDPSIAPPIIQTSPGYVSTLTLLDMTGAPWPVQDISWAGDFEVVPPEDGGNIVRITPLTAHGKGNISMRLVDMVTPITFTLNTQLEIVHYRFDAHVPRKGPLAQIPLVEQGGLKAVASSENILPFLDGVIPKGAEKLSITGLDGRTKAWRHNGKLILRTPLSLLSPSWEGSISSSEGMKIYVLKEVPVIVLSENGNVMQARVALGDMINE